MATVGAAIVAGACEPGATIAIDPANRGASVTFTITRGERGRPASIAAFRVDGCAARGSPAPESHWLTLAPDTAESIARITYGQPPAGWRSTQGPQLLVPGCYRAAVASAPPLEFDLLANGDVKARR